MEYIIGFIVGCIITGIVLTAMFCIRHPLLGTLKIDESDPENVKWRFVISKDVDFSKTKQIYLKVDNRANISHE